MPASEQDMTLAVNIPPNAPPHVYSASAEQFLEWGRPDGALKVSELGLQRHPGYTGLKVFRAEALLLHERFEQGEEDLRAVLAAEPQHPRAIRLLAQLLMGKKRYKDALPILERAEFILNDPEITEWLRIAETGAEQQVEEAPVAMTAFVYTEPVKERAADLARIPGVQAVRVSDGTCNLSLGPDSSTVGRRLEMLSGLDRRFTDIFEKLHFGSLTEFSLYEGDLLLTSRRGDQLTVRVAAGAQVREGLIAWHCSKVLEEEQA